MSYCNVCFDEGPWPGKAYDDARENARRRSASRPMNYGWTRPGVISLNGAYPDSETIYQGDQVVSPEYMAPGAMEGEVIIEGPIEELGSPLPQNAIPENGIPMSNSKPQASENKPVATIKAATKQSNENSVVLHADQVIRDDAVKQTGATQAVIEKLKATTQQGQQPPISNSSSIDWERFGMKRPNGGTRSGSLNKATIK